MRQDVRERRLKITLISMLTMSTFIRKDYCTYEFAAVQYERINFNFIVTVIVIVF